MDVMEEAKKKTEFTVTMENGHEFTGHIHLISYWHRTVLLHNEKYELLTTFEAIGA